MFFTHKFMDEVAHESVVKANMRDMIDQYILRNVRESFANMEIIHYADPEERIRRRVRTFINDNYETATMSDIADFASLIADEEIKLPRT